MAQKARDNRISRRTWLLAGLALPLFRVRAAENTLPPPRFDGDNLLLPSFPNFHFLTGKPLERLTNGNTVAFLAQITLYTDDRHTTIKNSGQRLILSRDIWDQTFKVTIPTMTPQNRLGLTANQAESWCLENLLISTADVPRDQPLWMRFAMRTVRQDDVSRVVGDRGISFLSIWEYISRKAGASEPSWEYETPHPFRLQDLPRLIFPRNTRAE